MPSRYPLAQMSSSLGWGSERPNPYPIGVRQLKQSRIRRTPAQAHRAQRRDMLVLVQHKTILLCYGNCRI